MTYFTSFWQKERYTYVSYLCSLKLVNRCIHTLIGTKAKKYVYVLLTSFYGMTYCHQVKRYYGVRQVIFVFSNLHHVLSRHFISVEALL